MKRTTGCFVAILVIALFLSVALNLSQWALTSDDFGELELSSQPAKKPEKFREHLVEAAKGKASDRIVHLDLDGIISSMSTESVFMEALPSMESLKRQLDQAAEDSRVKAIVLRINSPGGEVTASDILYQKVKKVAAQKPVVIYMDSLAASGGYYIACGATQIVASETTLTGSIGVIMETLNYADLFGKVGLSMNTFTSGAFKDSLSGARSMREDEKVYVQKLVTQMYDRFVGIVAEARKLPVEQLKAGVADGRVLLGREALESKLVDQIGYIEDAYTLARELGKCPEAAVVKYRGQPNFLEAFGLAAQTAAKGSAKVDVKLESSLLPSLRPGVPYYLSKFHAH
jgi:protease IV